MTQIEDLKNEKQNADDAFNNKTIALRQELNALTDSGKKQRLIRLITRHNERYPHGDRIRLLYILYSLSSSARYKYQDYLNAYKEKKEVEQKLKVQENIERYNKNKKLIQNLIGIEENDKLAVLKAAIGEMLVYIDENPNLKSMPIVSDMIDTLPEILEPSDLGNAKMLHKTFKFNFDSHVFPSYIYSIQSSKRYDNFAQYVDKVPGARDISNFLELMRMNVIGIVAVWLCAIITLSLALTSGVAWMSVGSLIPIILTAIGLVLGALTLAIHFTRYPRTELSKQLAIIADIILPIEEDRYKIRCTKTLDNFNKDLDTLINKEPALQEPVNFIRNTYPQDDNPQKTLSILKRLVFVQQAQSIKVFETKKKELINALQTQPSRINRFFFPTTLAKEIDSYLIGKLDSLKELENQQFMKRLGC